MKSRAIKIGFLVFAAACFAALGAVQISKVVERDDLETSQAATPAPASGPAPGFDLESWDGKKVSLESMRGKWVLVNFWATWCPPCAEEMPSLSAFARSFAAKGLTVLGVSVNDDWKTVKEFFPHGRPGFEILLDPGKKVSTGYGTVKFPESWLVDPSGKLTAKFIGARSWTDPRVVKYFEKLTGLR
jgi:peroxiredoxin